MRVDRFELEEELGRGGMGVVYRARDTGSGARVALKVLPALADTEELRRALVEARAGARLEHPGIARLLDAGRDAQGRHWIALELVAGETLQARLAREGLLPVAEALRVARDLALALEHAHGRGVLHRDLKPGNVMLGPGGRVVLLDLGLARLLDRETRITGTGEALGTPAFMAPEQVRGERERIGPATDVYGLSATLHTLLTGAPPFGEGSALATLQAVLERPAPSARALRPEVPAGVDAVVRRGLAKAPEERFPTVSALRAALEQAVRPSPAARRGLGRALLAAALLVGLAAAGGLALRREGPAPAAPAVAAPASAGAPEVEGSPARARVRALLEAGRRRSAEEEARRGLLAGEDPELRWLRARALHGLGEVVPALEELERALLRPPPAAPWLAEAEELLRRLRALALLVREVVACDRAGDLAGALAVADRAVTQLPEEPCAWLLRAHERQQAGRWAEALQDLDAALGRDPRLSTALELRARGLRETRGSLPDALGCIERALESDPDHLRLVSVRGMLRLDLGDVEGAMSDAERLVGSTADPGVTGSLAEGLALRARVLLERGDLAGARGDLDRYLTFEPDDLTLVQVRALTLERLGDLPGAEADHRRVVAGGSPREPWVQASRAWVLQRTKSESTRAWEGGDVAGARRLLDEALALDPRDSWALLRRAVVRRAQDDPAGGVADAERAAELDPDLVEARWVAAGGLIGLGRYEEADRVVQRGLLRAPADVQGLLLAARVAMARGQPQAALAALDRIAAPGPEARISMGFQRGQALLQLGRAAEARAVCEAAIALGPPDMFLAQLYGLRALASAALGEPEAALADRERVQRLAPGSPAAVLLDEQLREAGIR